LGLAGRLEVPGTGRGEGLNMKQETEAAAREIIDAVIGGLLRLECVENADHGVLGVWSGASEELISAAVAKAVAPWADAYSRLRLVASDIALVHSYTDCGSSDDALSRAIYRCGRVVKACRTLVGDERSYEALKQELSGRD